MSVVSIVSMKGGVGKTTLGANLAVALAARLGKNRVVFIGLDPSDSVPWHIGSENLENHTHRQKKGLSCLEFPVSDVSGLSYLSDSGVLCFPFGDASEVQRKAFEKMLQRKTTWLIDFINQARSNKDNLVLIDTPPGHSVYQQQALEVADLSIAVLLPDAASYATVPSMESSFAQFALGKPNMYLVNQYDQRQPLSVDVVRSLRQALGTRLVPILISQDEGVREALAVQKTYLQYDPHSQASHDTDQLSKWLIGAANRNQR